MYSSITHQQYNTTTQGETNGKPNKPKRAMRTATLQRTTETTPNQLRNRHGRGNWWKFSFTRTIQQTSHLLPLRKRSQDQETRDSLQNRSFRRRNRATLRSRSKTDWNENNRGAPREDSGFCVPTKEGEVGVHGIRGKPAPLLKTANSMIQRACFAVVFTFLVDVLYKCFAAVFL